MKKTDDAYLSGVMDSDGTICIYKNVSKNEYKLRLYVVNTRVGMIDWLLDNYGGFKYKRTSKNPKWNDKYEWIVEGKSIENILKKILPYLVIKKEQAKIALEFRSTFNLKKSRNGLSEEIIKKRHACFEKIKTLNKVGKMQMGIDSEPGTETK